MSYKWCAVPLCRNTSIQTPEKLFVSVPKDAKKRKTWLNLARRDPRDISHSSVIFFCEDHFDLEKDMANYIKYKMGFCNRIKMVEGVLPSKFKCQQVRGKEPPSVELVQNEVLETCEYIIDTNIHLKKEARKHTTQGIKMLDGQQEQNMRKIQPESLEWLETKVIQEYEDIDQGLYKQEDATNKARHRKEMVDIVLPSKFHNQQDLEKINCDEGSFRTISIEVLKTELIEDEGIIDRIITVQEVTAEDPITVDTYTEPVPLQEFMRCENSMNTVSHQRWNKNTSTDTVGIGEKSVQVCLKPKFRSKAVQTKIVNSSSLPYIHSTTNRSTSPLRINRSHCNIELSIKEIRELETSVRISDRKLFRSWESVKDSKDPEAYDSLLDEVKETIRRIADGKRLPPPMDTRSTRGVSLPLVLRHAFLVLKIPNSVLWPPNKQKTLSCMLQLIENRQALLSREQRKIETEDDAVVSLPTGKHQATRRGLKRRKRTHESRSEHKTQIAPKQVTLYITGSSTVDETESTRNSLELPSLELPQGPMPNIMFFTTNLT